MRNARCAINSEIDREGRGGGGAVTVSRFRLLRRVLLPWVVAATMLFGGGLAALAQSFTPGSPECTASGTTVTCKGDLSAGVEVKAGADGTYTELYVNTLDGDIDPPIGTGGIAFTSDSNSNIAITADIGDHSITLESAELSGISLDVIAGVLASSKGGDVEVDMTGTIIAKGDTGIDDKVRGQSRGIHARSSINLGESGDVTVIMDGDITTEGNNSQGIHASGGNVTVDVTGKITTILGNSSGITAESNNVGDVTVIMDGDILTRGGDSNGISASSEGGKVTVDMTGTITTLGGRSEAIAASLESGGDMKVIVNKGAVIKTKKSKGINVGGSGAGDMVMGVDVKGAVIETSGTTGSSGIDARFEDGDIALGDGIIGIAVNVTGSITTLGTGDLNYGIYASHVSAAKGSITVDVTGDITTAGTKSDGIFVKSESEGDGAVDVTVNGNITTSGTSSRGISASVNAGDGDVEIDVTGDILAKGLAGNAIDTAIAGGEINITLHGGSIISEQRVGVEFGGGDDEKVNSLTISEGAAVTIRGGERIRPNGDLQRFDDVLGGTGNETIDNKGTLTTPRTINLISADPNFVDVAGEQTNVFNNHTGATFYSGTSVVLGSDDEDLFSNAGNLSPGGANAVQKTTLTGNFQNFVAEEYGTFTVTIDGTKNDLLSVTGNATLNGGTVRVRGAYNDSDPYTILDVTGSNTLSGEFAEVIDTLFIDYGLDYDTPNTVKLTSARKQGVTFGEFAGTANQWAVANALDSLTPANAAVGDVMAVSTPDGARAAYDARSGEVHASLKGALVDAGQGTVAAVKSRMAAGFGNPGARTMTAAFGTSSLADGQNGLWVTGTGASGETDATSGTARMETDRRGVVFGVDRALSEGWRLGVLGGYSRTEVSQRARLSSGSVDTWSVGLYGGAESGAARFSFGAIYDGHAIDANRSVPSIGLPGIQHLSAGYDARSLQLFAEAGHEVQAGGLTLEPFAGVSSITLDTDGFSESGGDTALAASSDIDSMMFATLGLRGAMQVDDTIHLRGMAGWRHAFGDTDPSSTHTMANSSSFTVTGAPTAEDVLDTEFGIEVGLSDTAVLGLAYKGRYGDGDADHGFNAGLRVTF